MAKGKLSPEWQEYLDQMDEEELEEILAEPDQKKVIKYEFDIDHALDNMDLRFGGYTPSRDAVEFFSLMRLVMGEEPEVENSLMHYFLVDLIFGNIERHQYPYTKDIQDKIRINDRKIAIMTARGLAKSTTVTAFFPIYLAIKGTMPNFGSVMFVVGFGDSQQAGAKVQANTIRDICEDSLFCKDYFEKMRFTDEECEFTRKGNGKIKARSFMYKVKGAAGGSVRGIRYKTERPQIIIFDDIIKNEADANSKIIMKKLKSMMYADAENALGGKKGKIIIINTPFNKNDPVYQALESGIWTPVCIPMCERMDEEIEEDEFIGAWEPMHSFQRVKERYEDALGSSALREFNQELMLRISSDDDRMVPDSMIQWYSRADLERRLPEYNLYMTTDFTTTGGPASDLSGIASWALGSNSDYFLLDLSLRQQSMGEQYEEVFRMNKHWGALNQRTTTVGIEVDGQQKAHVFAIKEQMVKRNEWFTIGRQKGSKFGSEGILSRLEGGNKHWRFRMMLPLFQNRKIWFPEELRDTPQMKELLQEIKYCTYSGFGSKYDDGMDLISMLGAMEIITPMKYSGGLMISKKLSKRNPKIWGKQDYDSEPDAWESYN
ncbi:MAG: hypothetical protein KAS62_02440 [Candidatus Delongbacteria bacterium]|nr:hypothetical protein [Candidatus Delongbacteria bacterium]